MQKPSWPIISYEGCSTQKDINNAHDSWQDEMLVMLRNTVDKLIDSKQQKPVKGDVSCTQIEEGLLAFYMAAPELIRVHIPGEAVRAAYLAMRAALGDDKKPVFPIGCGLKEPDINVQHLYRYSYCGVDCEELYGVWCAAQEGAAELVALRELEAAVRHNMSRYLDWYEADTQAALRKLDTLKK